RSFRGVLQTRVTSRRRWVYWSGTNVGYSQQCINPSLHRAEQTCCILKVAFTSISKTAQDWRLIKSASVLVRTEEDPAFGKELTKRLSRPLIQSLQATYFIRPTSTSKAI